jgi:hypothetical protein
MFPGGSWHVFISHADEDSSVARQVASALAGRGLRCWLDKENLEAGQQFEDHIQTGILNSGVLLLLLSANSLRSHYVGLEVSQALGYRRPVVPVLLGEFEPGPLQPPFDRAMRYQGVVLKEPGSNEIYDRLADQLRRYARRQRARGWLRIGTVVLILALLIVGGRELMNPTRTPSSQATQPLGLASTLLQRQPPAPQTGLGALNPALQFNVKGLPQNGPAWMELNDGDQLASGDRYHIRIQPSTSGYLYLFQRDASGKIQWMFPSNETDPTNSFGANPVEAGQELFLPPVEGKAWALDDTVGKEYIFAVLSTTRWIGLETALKSGHLSLADSWPADVPEQLAQIKKGHSGVVNTGVRHGAVVENVPVTYSGIERRAYHHWLMDYRVIQHVPRPASL